MNVENPDMFSSRIVPGGSFIERLPDIEEEDRHQEHFNTEQSITQSEARTISGGFITMSAQAAAVAMEIFAFRRRRGETCSALATSGQIFIAKDGTKLCLAWRDAHLVNNVRRLRTGIQIYTLDPDAILWR
jgi:hypothetical protein